MRYLKYIVLIIFLFALNCSVKEPVGTEKREFTVEPGETVLMKLRNQDELFFVNATVSTITASIKAIGPVWDDNFNYVDSVSADSLYYGTQIIPVDSTRNWDHLISSTKNINKVGFSVYEIGIPDAKTRMSWIDDEYGDNPPYDQNDFTIRANSGTSLSIKPGGPDGPGSYQTATDKTFFIWDFLAGKENPSLGEFDTYNLDVVTGDSISGPDSLALQQSGNFTATHTSSGTRDTIFMDYTWWLKNANRTFSEQNQWKNKRTISHSSTQSFTLKTEIWDLIHDVVTPVDTYIVAVGPITGVSIYGPDSLRTDSIGTFTAALYPTHREGYYDDYDWAVWYFGDDRKKKNDKNGLRLPPTDEWIELDLWDRYRIITFSSSYYDFKLRVIATDDAYGHTKSDEKEVVLRD